MYINQVNSHLIVYTVTVVIPTKRHINHFFDAILDSLVQHTIQCILSHIQ